MSQIHDPVAAFEREIAALRAQLRRAEAELSEANALAESLQVSEHDLRAKLNALADVADHVALMLGDDCAHLEKLLRDAIAAARSDT